MSTMPRLNLWVGMDVRKFLMIADFHGVNRPGFAGDSFADRL